MWTIIKTIIIAIIQGLTEFLPVSSSGHIALSKSLLNLKIDSTFDIVVHLGTLIAVIIFYRKEIAELITGIFIKNTNSNFFGIDLQRKNYFKIWLLFIIATIPGAITGFILEYTGIFEYEPPVSKWKFLALAIFFIITGLFLISTIMVKQAKKNNIFELSYFDALIIGLFQAIAPLPGISRSGATITASMYTGLKKDDSARFSFILSIPLIIAAFLLKLIKLIQSENITDINYITILSIGLVVSFIAGYFSLILLVKLIKNGKFWVFSIYLVIPVVFSIVLFFTR